MDTVIGLYVMQKYEVNLDIIQNNMTANGESIEMLVKDLVVIKISGLKCQRKSGTSRKQTIMPLYPKCKSYIPEGEDFGIHVNSCKKGNAKIEHVANVMRKC